MIRVDGSSDINQLQTIIDDYKASGRSYTFDIGDILYTCTYTDFVDEDYEESWTCEYQDHIYSDVEVCNIDVYLNDKMDATGVWCKYLIVSADYNIQDNIIVGATVVIGSQPTLYQVALSASRHYMEYRLYTHTIPMPIIYISSKTVKPQYTDYIYYSYGNNRK